MPRLQRLQNVFRSYECSGVTEKWTIAIVVPDSLLADVERPLIAELRLYAATPRDAFSVKMSRRAVEKVIITNYDSIVGLEFDAVFLLGCDEAIKVGHKAEVQSVWVALSRPRQFHTLAMSAPSRFSGSLRLMRSDVMSLEEKVHTYGIRT